MTDNRLARAFEAAACNTLGQLGNGLVNMAAWSLGTGQAKPALIGITAGMASNLAYSYACGEQDLGESSTDEPARTGCQEFSEGLGQLWFKYERNGIPQEEAKTGLIAAYQLETTYTEEGLHGGFYMEGTLWIKRTSTSPWTIEPGGWGWSRDQGQSFEFRGQPGAVCGTPVGEGPQPPPPTEPYEYTDEETGCTLNVEFQGFIEPYKGGPVEPVFLMSSPESDPEGRNSGGRMGGCNFEPTIVYGGPGGGGGGGGGNNPINIPVPPGGLPPRLPDGEPWWLPLLKGAIQGAAGAVVNQLLDEIFEEKFSADTYLLTGICEDPDDNGNQPEFSRPVAGGDFYTAAMSRLDAMQDLLQAHLGYKTPICGFDEEEPEVFAHFRSLRFESAERTRDGRNSCRKLFRYRGATPGDIEQLGKYWGGFSWNTGPYIVKHEGSALGAPQVWASSVDEGQRVIRHAAGEAGIDPDQVGKWRVSSSNHPRYGVSHTVSLVCIDGCWSVTSRPGPNGLPEAPLVQLDPGVELLQANKMR